MWIEPLVYRNGKSNQYVVHVFVSMRIIAVSCEEQNKHAPYIQLRPTGKSKEKPNTDTPLTLELNLWIESNFRLGTANTDIFFSVRSNS